MTGVITTGHAIDTRGRNDISVYGGTAIITGRVTDLTSMTGKNLTILSNNKIYL